MFFVGCFGAYLGCLVVCLFCLLVCNFVVDLLLVFIVCLFCFGFSEVGVVDLLVDCRIRTTFAVC